MIPVSQRTACQVAECCNVLEVLLQRGDLSLESSAHGLYMISRMPPMTPPTMAAKPKRIPIVMPAAPPAGKLFPTKRSPKR